MGKQAHSNALAADATQRQADVCSTSRSGLTAEVEFVVRRSLQFARLLRSTQVAAASVRDSALSGKHPLPAMSGHLRVAAFPLRTTPID